MQTGSSRGSYEFATLHRDDLELCCLNCYN